MLLSVVSNCTSCGAMEDASTLESSSNLIITLHPILKWIWTMERKFYNHQFANKSHIKLQCCSSGIHMYIYLCLYIPVIVCTIGTACFLPYNEPILTRAMRVLYSSATCKQIQTLQNSWMAWDALMFCSLAIAGRVLHEVVKLIRKQQTVIWQVVLSISGLTSFIQTTKTGPSEGFERWGGCNQVREAREILRPRALN